MPRGTQRGQGPQRPSGAAVAQRADHLGDHLRQRATVGGPRWGGKKHGWNAGDVTNDWEILGNIEISGKSLGHYWEIIEKFGHEERCGENGCILKKLEDNRICETVGCFGRMWDLSKKKSVDIFQLKENTQLGLRPPTCEKLNVKNVGIHWTEVDWSSDDPMWEIIINNYPLVI